ncbi:MAG: hypothetical protein ACTSR0_05115 [Candidatus Asgardarchaeia archaeon]
MRRRSIIVFLALIFLGIPILSVTTVDTSFAVNVSSIEYKTINVGDVVKGTINGTNLEDYYLVHFSLGFYNITLYTDTGSPPYLEVFLKDKGQLFPVATPQQVGSNKRVLLQSFLPSIVIPIDTLILYEYTDEYFSTYGYSLVFEEDFFGISGIAPPEYVYMGYYCGLFFVYPPAGDYVLRISSYSEVNYTLSVKLINGVKEISVGSKAEVSDLEYRYYGTSFLGSAIFSFTPQKRDIYMINVSWTDPGDYVRMMVSDERGVVMAYLEKKTGNEHLYIILNKGVTYYITATFSNDYTPSGPINVSAEVQEMSAETLSPGDVLIGTFTNPYDPQDELYILNYTPGYFYNITLNVPSTADYDLFINSPFYGTLSWNTVESDLSGFGVDENITMFASFVGLYVGLADGETKVGISGFQLPPNLDSLIVRVSNSSGSGDYVLKVESYPIPTYNKTTDEVIKFNDENHPWYKVFKIDKKAGFEYEITWNYNILESGTPPILMYLPPMVELFEAGVFVSDAVPEYSHLGAISLLSMFFYPVAEEGTFRKDVYSVTNSSAYIVLFSFEQPANMTLSVEEKGAESIGVGEEKSGALNTGEGILYTVHLQPGVYRIVLNYTMAPTGGSWFYPSHPKPVIVFDENGNYIPTYVDYPFGEYEGQKASVIIHVGEEGDYYLWLESKNPILAFSETEYTIRVEVLYVVERAPAGILELIIQNATWIGLGFGIGLVMTAIIAVKRR